MHSLAYVREHRRTPLSAPEPRVRLDGALPPALCVEELSAVSSAPAFYRACDLIESGTFSDLFADSGSLAGRVHCPSGAVYDVSISQGPRKTQTHDYLQVVCTCPEGQEVRACKHGIALSLFALGYSPDVRESGEEHSGLEPHAALSALNREDLVDILQRACSRHPDVAAAVVQAAAPGEVVVLIEQAWGAVDSVLADYDWERNWKQSGSAAAVPLWQLLSDARQDPGTRAATGVAVAVAACRALTAYPVEDRENDLSMAVGDGLAYAAACTRALTSESREHLGEAWSALAQFGKGRWELLLGRSGDGEEDVSPLLARALGREGRAVVRTAISRLSAQVREARARPSQPSVQVTRERQLEELTSQLRELRSLLRSLTSYARISADR